jgi:hypothetical protein
MISKEQNIALLIVGNSALKNSDWADYANYCFGIEKWSRKKGVRKEAYRYLNNFLKSTETWTTECKIEFVKFLFPFFETVECVYLVSFSQRLSDELIEPTLKKWCETEKADGYPFRWYGKYYHSENHLLKTLEIDPKDYIARETILNRWVHKIFLSVRHLPRAYMGEPFDDMKLGGKIKEQIRQLTTTLLSEHWTSKLEEHLELVRNYIDWNASKHPDFGKWGLENKRKTNLEPAITYSWK